jgi:hypothetical protein
MKKNRRRNPRTLFWATALLIGALVGAALATTAQAAPDCGSEPCPGTLPAIWPHPSKTEGDTVRVLGWNLQPDTAYEVVLVHPDDIPLYSGTITSDAEGDFLGRYKGVNGQPYLCTVPYPAVIGVYQVRLYLSPWSGSLEEVPVAATSFYHE